MQTCTHRLINDTNKKNVKECDSLRILRVGSSCLGSGTASSCCRLQGQLLPSIRLPSCSHLLNRAFNKPSPIIQLRVVSVSSWDYFSGKTSCPHLHPSLSLPPSAFLFQALLSHSSSALWLALSLGGQEQNIPSFGAARVLAAFQSGLPIPHALSGSTPASSPHSSLRSSYAFFLIEDQFHFPV